VTAKKRIKDESNTKHFFYFLSLLLVSTFYGFSAPPLLTITIILCRQWRTLPKLLD
jgi:hypothetical protein